MNKGLEIARGKTKILYENPGQPHQLVVAQTDAISAGDGARPTALRKTAAKLRLSVWPAKLMPSQALRFP